MTIAWRNVLYPIALFSTPGVLLYAHRAWYNPRKFSQLPTGSWKPFVTNFRAGIMVGVSVAIISLAFAPLV